MRQQMTELTYC